MREESEDDGQKGLSACAGSKYRKLYRISINRLQSGCGIFIANMIRCCSTTTEVPAPLRGYDSRLLEIEIPVW